ncbi:MAG TPA: sulfotransferase, partial [Rhodanobacteraceae bacterium]|nr:sulfotransferase [Rhodanobacteraceae bacterium]
MNHDDVTGPIVAAVKAGALGEAERLCRLRLEQQPGDSNVLLLLGLSLQRQGRLAEAVSPYARLTELHPENSMHWGNYATALRVAGDVEGALRAAETAVERAPDEPQRLEQLGLLFLQLGRLPDARDTLLRAWAKAPDSPGIRIHAARGCIACRDTRADILLAPWREWLPLDDDLQCELADLLSQVGEVRATVELLEDLVARVPSDVTALLLLAKGYERVNRVDDAAEVLDRIAASPAAAEGVGREIAIQQAQLAMRRRAYAEARTLLEGLGDFSDTEYGHLYSLAKACDKLGDAAAAMEVLRIAHQRQGDEIRQYAGHLFAPDAPPLPHANDRLDAEDFRKWPDLAGPDLAQSPVFVVGFPRSGTTLLEQMLDAHPRMQSMDERPFLNNLADQLGDIGIKVPRDLHTLDQRDCDELRKGYLILACGKVPRRWDARLVDKNPLNMMWVPMIHRMFPRAKFILALRHPCDVILSCYMQNFRAAPLAAASRSLERLARAYVTAMENWRYHEALIRPDVFVSRYEELVADTPGRTRKIAEFLQLDDAESMLRFDARAREKGYIATPSYTQVIEPVNARSIGHWHQYRKYFEPVLP